MKTIGPFLDYYKKLYDAASIQPAGKHRDNARTLFQESLEFLERIPYEQMSTVLDIGLGYGFHCKYFARKGLRVTGIANALHPEALSDAEKGGYRVKEMDMHFLDCRDESFDLVWSNHSIEHSFSPLLCLREWYRVLKKGGHLAISVPPHKNDIVSGHFNVGWSTGQLLYLLGMAGFAVKNGYFIEQGYNVRALVTKPQVPVDPAGLSWICNLKEHLPAGIQSRLQFSAASLGKYFYNGNMQVLSGDVCIEKTGNGALRPGTGKISFKQRLKNILRKTLP